MLLVLFNFVFLSFDIKKLIFCLKFVLINRKILIFKDCSDSFSSKSEMESKGWVFDWNDEYVFRPQLCSNVPLTSYCGFRFPGDGEISFAFSSNGRGNLTYGQSYAQGSVHVYMNNQELGSTNSITTSSISFEYSYLF